ncbi:MAG: PAN domain-containing protein [Parvularculaceae bacterium]
MAGRALAFACAMLATVLVSAVSPAAAGEPEIGVDRPGSDYQAPITLEPKQGSFLTYENECQGLCAKEQKCMAWTMVKPGVQGPKAKCYLKSAVPPLKSNACCSSGVADRATQNAAADPGEPEIGMDRPGSDYQPPVDLAPKQGSFLTYEMECKGLCMSDQRCKAWAVVKPGVQGPKAKCYLKDKVPAAKQNGCCSSGVAVRKVEAAKLDPAIAADRDPRGKSAEQCAASRQRNDVRCMQFGVPGMYSCNAEVAQIYGACVSLAAQTAADFDPRGKTIEQCTAARQRREARCAQFPLNAKFGCDAEVAGFFNACVGLAQAAQSTPGTIDNTGGGAPAPAPAPAPSSGVPPEWADMLAAHNDTRKSHCAPALSWSAQLASAAQEWANKCTNVHGAQGENLAFWSPTATNVNAYQNTWACEVQHYDFDNPKVVGGFKKGCDAPVNGHFTQVVWKDSRELGCGKQTCTINGATGVYTVCRYSPQGNFNADNISNLTAQVSRPKC